MDFLEIIRQDRGSSTPVDEFMSHLHCYAQRAYTPEEDIRKEMEACEENWRYAMRDSQQLVPQYDGATTSIH